MGSLAKEFETTCQLPPSTPQQHVTPPTVLLPATYAVLPPHSAALSAAIAAATNAGPSTPGTHQHGIFPMPMLGHSLAAAAATACTSPSAGGLVSPSSSPSMLFGAATMFPAVDTNGNAAASFANAALPRSSSVSETTITATGYPVLDQQSSLRRKDDRSRLSILLPSPCASAQTAPPTSTHAGGHPFPQLAPHPHLLHHPNSDSPAEPGSRLSTTEDEDYLPLTPVSPTYATWRSASAFDSALLAVFDRAGGQSRAHSCNSRSGSAFGPPRPPSAVPAVNQLTSPTAYLQAAHSDLLWHLHGTHTAASAAAAAAAAAGETAATARPPGTNTPSSVPSARSTPPAMSSHAAPGQPYAFWTADGVCALCPITSCVEATSREEQSGCRTSTSSSSAQQQQRSVHRTSSTGASPSAADAHKAAAAATTSTSRRNGPRTNISLREGPALMATPVSTSAGHHTPSSPLFLATAMHLHTDPTSHFAGQVGSPPSGDAFVDNGLPVMPACDPRQRETASLRYVEEGDIVSSFLNASRSPTPPSANFVSAGASRGLRHPSCSMPLATFTGSSATCVGRGDSGSLGATDPLSDNLTRSPSSLQQQQQQHTMLRSDGAQHPAYNTTPRTGTPTASATSAFSGNLTFVPIEVMPTPIVTPFFHSGVPPADTPYTQSRSSPSASRGSHHDVAAPRVPVMPHLESPAHATEDAPPLSLSSSSSAWCPYSSTMPARVRGAWPPTAAPGTVTAILAAPEVSWSAFRTVAENAAIAAAAEASSNGTDSGRGGRERSASVATTTETQSPATSLHLARATSPTPWLHSVGGSGGTSVNTAASTAPTHFPYNGSSADDGSLHRGTPASNYHAYPAAPPSFHSTVQFQLSCAAVPLEDLESSCVICLEGHSNPPEDNNRVSAATDEAQAGITAEAAWRADHSGGVKPGSQLLVMPCKHCCHQNCLQRWLMESMCCPICRRDLTQDATLPS